MLYKPALSLLALGLLLTPAQAVQAQPEEELAPGFAMCMKEAYSTMAMVECLQQAYEYWDGELNRNYKAIMSVYAKSPDLAETRKNLQKAQRAWIGYRDSTAKYFGGRTGGSE
ncbi:MAG: lysozyme inhibitor LprI family protein, partial [Desulfovibrionaceae bacterium]|nr:lysozyme inhibitor LprI family protein [Desulfovibrionaceae bacterium]